MENWRNKWKFKTSTCSFFCMNETNSKTSQPKFFFTSIVLQLIIIPYMYSQVILFIIMELINGILQARYCSYQNENSTEQQHEYEESTEEFKYVEKLLNNKMIPTPPQHAEYPTPSGWYPQAGKYQIKFTVRLLNPIWGSPGHTRIEFYNRRK